MSDLNQSLPSQGVFAGDNSLRDFLDPDNHPFLPLVELPSDLNPYRDRGVRVFAKLMSFLPLANVKSLPAYNMLEELDRNGGLVGKDAIVESSSGNTVASLAVIGRQYGLPRTRALVSSEVAPGKLNLLRLFGAEVVINTEPICPNPADPTTGIHRAKQLGRSEPGFVNPGQYDNPANPAAHERWTGPQIWEQTAGKIRIFRAGLGTTGTLYGASQYLKSRNEAIRVVGAARRPNNPVPGVRTKGLLRAIAFDWPAALDELVEVNSRDSFAASVELCRRGILAGPSSGFAYAGLLDYLSKLDAGSLDDLRDENGEVIAVFLAPDGPFPYLDEYFEYLDESFFPPVENRELLQRRTETRPPTYNDSVDPGISIDEAIARLYPNGIPSQEAKLPKGIRLIDVRDGHEFEDHHLSGAENIELSDLTRDPAAYISSEGDQEIIFVCASDTRSRLAADLAAQRGAKARFLIGGTMEWSDRGLPRIRPDVCAI